MKHTSLKPIHWVTDARRDGIRAKGWLRAHKWWLLRRASQMSLLLIFALGPWMGLWIARGNFASSELFGLVSLSDPLILLQSALAGHAVATVALTGAVIVLVFYGLVGGRVYCSWVCPVNIVTDSAHWLREKLGITRDRKLNKNTRYVVLAAALGASVASGTIAWEFINPVSLLQRGVIFGIGFGWTIILALFLCDLLIARRAWCGHICPVGAFYGLLGAKSLVRVDAKNRKDCNNCGACFRACTEPHVITPALKGENSVILSGDCTNCGSCIDVCPTDVFSMTVTLGKRDG